jgi:hypothetical protein
MREDLQNKLYEEFPEIFQQKDQDMTRTAMCWGISCGDGWFNIIRGLCISIQQAVDNPRKELKRLSESLEKAVAAEEKDVELIEFYEKNISNLKNEIIDQVQAVQVKEKFGTLRFYTNGFFNEKIENYIDMAENLSEITCEDCGLPGKANDGGWIKVRCESCEGKI